MLDDDFSRYTSSHASFATEVHQQNTPPTSFYKESKNNHYKFWHKFCSLYHHHHHYHHQVACSWQIITVSTSWHHCHRSCTCCNAELRPRLCGWRSSSTVSNHVHLDQPLCPCQSAGRCLMAACRACVWPCDRTARVKWLNRCSM